MIVAVQAHNSGQYPAIMRQMFETRKKVFFDTLHWDVSVDGNEERDRYDDMGPVYLIWCNHDRTRHFGSMRLMPTTGPTLLHDVFSSTFPDAAALSAPGIWEGTRMCLDEDALAQNFPHMPPRHAFCLLLVALCEFCLDHGIHTMVSNYEPHLARLYRRAGARLHELGRADGFGRLPVCCGAFEVSDDVLRSMRTALGLFFPLYNTERPLTSILGQCSSAA